MTATVEGLAATVGELTAQVSALKTDVAALKAVPQQSSLAWLAPYIPGMKSTLIAVISAALGSAGTYVSAPEKVKTVEVKGDPAPPPINIHLPPMYEVKKDDKKQALPVTVRPAGEEKK